VVITLALIITLAPTRRHTAHVHISSSRSPTWGLGAGMACAGGDGGAGGGGSRGGDGAR
jgi:hypothetical protein